MSIYSRIFHWITFFHWVFFTQLLKKSICHVSDNHNLYDYSVLLVSVPIILPVSWSQGENSVAWIHALPVGLPALTPSTAWSPKRHLELAWYTELGVDPCIARCEPKQQASKTVQYLVYYNFKSCNNIVQTLHISLTSFINIKISFFTLIHFLWNFG